MKRTSPLPHQARTTTRFERAAGIPILTCPIVILGEVMKLDESIWVGHERSSNGRWKS